MAGRYLEFVAQRHQICANSPVIASAKYSGLRCAVWRKGIASRVASYNDSRGYNEEDYEHES
jgi:hypothetical protein